jgi:hypothetical protein
MQHGNSRRLREARLRGGAGKAFLIYGWVRRLSTRHGERFSVTGPTLAAGRTALQVRFDRTTSPSTKGVPVKYSTSLLTATNLVLAATLLGACAEQPSDTQGDVSDAELLAHTPRSGVPSAALLALLPDYTQLDSAAVGGSGGSMHLSVDAGGDIPRQPDDFIHSVAVFGYAWADLDTGKGIVAVIHPTIGRDSKQNPDGWHTHPVQLTGGSGTSDFCIVSIGRSQAGIAIQGDLLRTNMALQWTGLDVNALDVAASFVVQVDAGCSGSGLGVHLLDTENL